MYFWGYKIVEQRVVYIRVWGDFVGFLVWVFFYMGEEACLELER